MQNVQNVKQVKYKNLFLLYKLLLKTGYRVTTSRSCEKCTDSNCKICTSNKDVCN